MAKRRKNQRRKRRSKNSAWQRFVKKHQGKGYSMKKLSRMYKSQSRNNPRRKNYGLVPRDPVRAGAGLDLGSGIGAMLLVGLIGFAIGRGAQQRPLI